MKDDAMEIDELESREIRCPSEFLRTRTSPDKGLGGTWASVDTRRMGGSQAPARVVSEVEGVGFNWAGG